MMALAHINTQNKHRNKTRQYLNSPKQGSVKAAKPVPKAYWHRQQQDEIRRVTIYRPESIDWALERWNIKLGRPGYRAPEQVWCLRHGVVGTKSKVWLRQNVICLGKGKRRVWRESQPTDQRKRISASKAMYSKLGWEWVPSSQCV